jgi:hypothetical protein
VFIGNGETAASPNNAILSATGGTGTDIAGASLTIRGGASTGSAAGGPIIFSTRQSGAASGTTVRAASERMRIDPSGNVGIGTSSPSEKVDVITGTNGAVVFRQKASAPWSAGDYTELKMGATGGNAIIRCTQAESSAASSAASFSFYTTSNLNVTAERLNIGTTGVITFNAYGSGTLSTNASGVISASDGRYKTKTRHIDTALPVIQSLQPTYFRWHEDSPFASEYEELGFIAQEVAAIIPEASPGENEEGKFRNYHDRAILAMLVKGVQELKAINDAQAQRIETLEANNAALEARIAAIENGA